MKTWSETAEVQPLASRIITNSIQKDRLSHAYLLQGERGTGKEAVALLLAKSLFCTKRSGVEPCQECRDCNRIESGNHPDMHWIEPDGQSIRKEQIEYLQKEFSYSGLESDQKVYVIKSAETMTANASNRLLKFLEEPSKKATAILMTENSSSILPTIRSRCQMIDFKPLNPQAFQQQLVEHDVSRSNAVLISALTNNLDEAIAWSTDDWFAQARKLMVQLIETFSSNQNDVFLFIHQKWLPHFKERTQQEQGLDLLLLGFKDILFYHLGKTKDLVVFEQNDTRIENLVMFFSQEKLLDNLNKLLDAKRKLKQNVNPTLVMEELIIQIQG
ncbi:DNA polymerase III, delta prime subunit [Lentibacillus persicus]|uniref:DNA polymerase III subunit delta' n=1 Tax=Lentibacillus persicus TaxID=640948 RepID=A0A1I1UWY8_9BACI|nr:DNA polymerase III subunit delta' [Lentibacillus persicus]SFD72540.1 DNA polymerase III, delta prime subunit [Lentibacillus persicus]